MNDRRVQKIEVLPAAATMIQRSKHGPSIAYAIAKGVATGDAEAFEVLATLQLGKPEQIAQVLGKAEATIEYEIAHHRQPQQPQPKRPTQAPPPIRPLKGGAAPPSEEARLDAWLNKTYR